MPVPGRAVAMIIAVAAAVCPLLLTGTGAARAGTPVPAAARTGATGGTWHNAIEVPSMAGLSTNESGVINSVSCSSAGNCTAGGTYNYWQGNNYHSEAFVVSEVNGTWDNAIGALVQQLSGGGNGSTAAVSCASAGNCLATGTYTPYLSPSHVFVDSQVKGAWQGAAEIPGTAALDPGGGEGVSSVSCRTAGNCTLGGFYGQDSAHTQAMVADEVNGTWRNAVELPGTAALNAGGNAWVTSVSCGSAGNCSAGGYYTDGSQHQQAFVARQVNGTWRKAIAVPGTTTLNAGGNAQITSVSCASATDCSAGGYYTDGSQHQQAFVARQVNGTWRKAIAVPGTIALNIGGMARVTSVSCASAGNCSAGGNYANGASFSLAFIDNEVHGHWGKAIEVPGTSPRSLGESASVSSVSCGAAGNCSARGFRTDSAANEMPYVVSQVNGIWRRAAAVPGMAALGGYGWGAVRSMSCSSATSCSAGGSYFDSSDNPQPFVVSKS